MTTTEQEKRYEWVRVVWGKVIQRAAFDMVIFADHNDIEKQRWARTGKEWLFGKSCLGNSFEDICFLCRIDPNKIRRWAKSLTKADVKKIEIMERSRAGLKSFYNTESVKAYLDSLDDYDEHEFEYNRLHANFLEA